MTMTKPTSEQVTFLASGSGASQRTVLDKLRDVVSVKDFGAVGDGVADDTAAIQAAMNYSGLRQSEVVFPEGIYRITSALQWNQTIRLRGVAKSTGCIIVAGAAMNAVIQASTVDAQTNLTSRSCFDGININGNNLAAFGYQGKTNHTTFRNLRVSSTTTAAMEIGYGWCNLYDNVETSYNSGDGIRLGADSNQNLLTSVKSFSNSGFGVVAAGSTAVKFSNCVFEACNKGGVYFQYGMKGFSIDTCYFELNGSVGYTFTSPTTYTVKADIIINGAALAATLAAAFPCTGTITGCFTNTPGDCFVFGPALRDSIIEGNVLNDSATPYPIYRCFGNNTSGSTSFSFGSPNNVRIGPNTRFLQVIDIDQAANPVYLVDRQRSLTRLNGALSQNLAEIDLSKWYNVSSGSGGTFTRSSVELDANPSVPVWDLNFSAGPFTTHVFGFTFDSSKYVKFHNLWMLFGLWVKAPYVLGSSDGVVNVFANSASSSSSYADWASLGWVQVVTAFKMPTTATRLFGIRTTVASGTSAGALHVAAPVLCQLGADYDAILGSIGAQNQFYGTSAPSNGVWKRGDIVWNVTPSAGNDPGFMCVTAGTPGTWKAMANLDV